jgi:hypothetical protein
VKVTVHPDAIGRLLEDVTQAWAKEAREVLPAAMGAAAPVGPTRKDRPRQGGLLSRSHRAEFKGTTKRPKVVVVAETPYSFITHEGRGPVVPMQASILRWFENSDDPIFARKVGPAEGQPWMVETFRELGFTEVRHIQG